jgi:hypothetical protein
MMPTFPRSSLSFRTAGFPQYGWKNAFLNIRRVQLVQLAAFHRLPASYGQREAAEAGGLMTYGPSILVASFNQFERI